MSAPLADTAAHEVALGREAEEEWQRFRRQLELDDAFWLGFLFTDRHDVARAYLARTDGLLHFRARRVLRLPAGSPAELAALVPRLFGEDVAAADLTWLEIDPIARSAHPEADWLVAWDDFFLRLNERRDRLRSSLRGPLVISAPRAVKPRARDAAPDLWSVRSMVLELGPPAASLGELRERQEVYSVDSSLPMPFAGAGGAPRPLDPDIAERLRRAEGHLAVARPEAAIPIAAEAAELLTRRGASPAPALWLLARAELASGDLAAAQDHAEALLRQDDDESPAVRLQRLTFLAYLYTRSENPARAEGLLRRALELAGETPESEAPAAATRLLLLEGLGDTVVIQGRLDEAASLRHDTLAVARQLVERHGEIPERLRDVSVNLGKLGDVQLAQGDARGARRSYEESLEFGRRLLREHGETPERLRDVSVSLDRLGDVQRAHGDVSRARRSFEESQELGRRLLGEYGETPERLRDVSVSLCKLGDLQFEDGDVSGARQSYEMSLELDRRSLRQHGESPERLRDVSVSLCKLGDVQLEEGDDFGARLSYGESLELDRRLLREYGETPERLRDVSVSLDRLGDVQLAHGDDSGARRSFEEALELRRRLLRTYGETPERLRGVSVSLERLGHVQLEQGDASGARRSYEDSLELTCRLLREQGESPERLRDLAVSEMKLAVVEEKPQVSLARLERARDVLRRILDDYGETSPRHRDVETIERMIDEMRATLIAEPVTSSLPPPPDPAEEPSR